MFVHNTTVDTSHIYKFYIFGIISIISDASDLYSFKRVDSFLQNTDITYICRGTHFPIIVYHIYQRICWPDENCEYVQYIPIFDICIIILYFICSLHVLNIRIRYFFRLIGIWNMFNKSCRKMCRIMNIYYH